MMLGIGCVGLIWARRERKALEAKKPWGPEEKARFQQCRACQRKERGLDD
jgi:hypothetical protein